MSKKVFIVHAHPEVKSFNGAMTLAAVETFQAQGCEVKVSDLYAMGFDPVSDRRNFTTIHDADYYKQQLEEMHAFENNGFAPDIQAEMDKLFWCDLLILQFPLWWFGMPGIMKGWVDRVFAMGKIYGGGKFYDEGVFRGKKAMCSVTTGGPGTMYMPDGLNGDIDQILFPINHGIFFFTGFTPLPPFMVYSPVRLSDEERAVHLARYRKTLEGIDALAPIVYPGLAEYDDAMRLKQSAAAK